MEIDEAFLQSPERQPQILELEEVLDRLALLDPNLAQIVEFRFYAGMTEEEISLVLGKGVRTVKRDWRKARTWLYKELNPAPYIPSASRDQ